MKKASFILLLVISSWISISRAQNIPLNNDRNGQIKLYPIEDNQKPSSLLLKQNYPNPFKNATNFEISIPSTGIVKLTIYSLLGKELVKLVDQELTSGRYRVEWEAGGTEEGVYFYILEFGGVSQTKSFKIIR